MAAGCWATPGGPRQGGGTWGAQPHPPKSTLSPPPPSQGAQSGYSATPSAAHLNGPLLFHVPQSLSDRGDPGSSDHST